MKISHIESLKKILIYGYGREGKSSKKFLKRFTNLSIDILDENIVKFSKNNDFKKYDAIVVSAGITREKIPQDFHHLCTSNTEIFFNNIDEIQRKKIIGISGTKGKSTTTKFCTEFLKNAKLKVKIGGNYGVPLLNLYDKFLAGKFDYIIAELSSYQLENVKVSPYFAIFLNFFPDHLDRHGNLANYWEAKSSLWKHQKESDILIIPETHNDIIKDISTEANLVTAPRLMREHFKENSIFRARHWLENLGTVRKLGEVLSIKNIYMVLKKTAQEFEGLDHRMQYFTEKNHIHFYDDSISTNPHSTLASVSFFSEFLGCILLGGQHRGQEFTELVQRLTQLNTLIIVLPAETRANLLKTIEIVGTTNFIDIKKWKGFDEIAKIVFEKTPPEKICLLSCAAPSYDLFNDFIDRGTQWKDAVNK